MLYCVVKIKIKYVHSEFISCVSFGIEWVVVIKNRGGVEGIVWVGCLSACD